MIRLLILQAQCGLIHSSITALQAYPIVFLIRDAVQCWRLTRGAQEVRCKSALSGWEASSLRNGSQQSGPSAALPLVPNRKPVEAQSAGLFQACKWISPIPPRFVKWGSMGLLLFFSASLSPHSSVMSTVKWRRKLGPGKNPERK